MGRTVTCHHELNGRKSELFDLNVTQLFQFQEQNGNPFDLTQIQGLHPSQPCHNVQC